MNKLETLPEPSGGRPLWTGLLLGALLMTFVIAFIYVAYLFLVWGQSAVAQLPEMPPLEVPRLVRSVNAAGPQTTAGAGSLLEPLVRRVQEAPVPLSGRTTVLLVGVDARPGQSGAGAKLGATCFEPQPS